MPMKNKWIMISLITSLSSIILSSLFNQGDKINDVVINTIYTLSGIMFSIGMGIICTFNPSSIKNQSIFQRVKTNIINLRNSFLFYFALSTITFLLNAVLSRYSLSIKGITIIVDAQIFALLFSLVSMLYFIINFIFVQKLVFDIAERVNKEEEK